MASICTADVMGSATIASFTFLLRVPDFVPDYANFDAATICAADAIITYDGEEIADALRDVPCCSTNQSGDKAGEPINISIGSLMRRISPMVIGSFCGFPQSHCPP
ncbi:MAG: hypothetical protein OEY72_01540 [Gammaproteobacteria bacterium]|nr:hypothetical protein [Gammaproteobacteria bacterium]